MQNREGNLYRLIGKLINLFLRDIRNGLVSYNRGTFTSRLSVLIIFFFFCYALVAFQICNIAIFYEDTIRITYAAENIPKRKNIVDRNGNILASNLSSVSIYANPKQILNLDATLSKLTTALPDVDIYKLKEKFSSTKSFVWVKRNVTPKEQQKVNNLGLPGIYYEVSEKRAYPYGKLFAHALGYVGLDGNGLAGIEKQYDKFLKDFDNNEQNLKLSLDVKLQNIVREELQKAIAEFSAIGGTAVIQNVRNGEILSFVSLPDYDPHVPGNANDNQLFNRGTLGLYELGSIFKVFTVAMALDKGVVNPKDAYDVTTPIAFKKHTIKDLYPKKGYLSVPEILIYSSNIGTVQIAFEVGKESQYDYLKSLGFLSKLNIDFPEVSPPLYPSKARWNDINSATISYGHGISVPPLVAIRAFNTAVNGGYLVNSTFSLANEEFRYGKEVFSDKTSEQIRKMLYLVVEHGSGKNAKVEGYYVGGKSGTANKAINGQYSKTARVSTFLAAFPIHDPQYSIMVMLDEPKGTKKTFGFATAGWVCAPATARIVKRMVNVYNIAPYKDDIDQQLQLEYDTSSERKYL
jgi:cell division protein FtsI (penicillin-binding protein 3)